MNSYDRSTHASLRLMEGFPPPPDKRVDKSNAFSTPPYNRWAYQNMRRVMPSAGIPVAPSPVDLPVRPDGRLDDISVARTDGSEADFNTFLEETFTDSLVVVSGGRVVCERYFNGMSAAQPHQMMSCTKSFVGLFALLAVERGLIAEGDRVGELIPEVDNGGAFADATLAQLLDMTNSMSFDEEYTNLDADIWDYVRVFGAGPDAKRDLPSTDIYGYLATLRRNDEVPHGEVFHYQTPKTDMANWVTNRHTGQSLIDDFEWLWSQLGTDGEAYILVDPAGTPMAGGGLNATPRDLARFAYMVASDGYFNGQQVIPTSVIDKLSGGGSIPAFLRGPERKGDMGEGEWSYRAKWWVRHTPGREAVAAIGVHGQWIYCDRARQIAIVKHGSLPVAAEIEFDDYVLHGFDAIIDALQG